MPYNTVIRETTNKGKVLEFEIDVGLRNDMLCFIRERIIHNLEATKRYLDLKEEDYDHICAGLYTYAVEEYGKILFLSDLNPTPPNNKIKIPYTHYDKGFLDHDHKFNLALSALPDSYKVLHEGDYNSEDYVADDYVVDTPADMKARMAVFYADFDEKDNYNSILRPLEVNRDLLIKAVNKFLKFMKAQKYP